jgi:hypothetical protein
MKAKTASSRQRRIRKNRAHWINDQFVCSCGSPKFTIFRERVARKVHTRNSHRRRRAAVCENNHKTRVAFR